MPKEIVLELRPHHITGYVGRKSYWGCYRAWESSRIL